VLWAIIDRPRFVRQNAISKSLSRQLTLVLIFHQRSRKLHFERVGKTKFMKMKKNKFISSILALTIVLSSCTNPTSNSESVKEPGTQEQKADEKKDNCKCSDVDVNRLASKIEDDFTQTQNQLESQYARVIRKESVDKRDNCTWVVTFKISWPFGNTDGAHPDEFIKKRFACDGKEIYVQ